MNKSLSITLASNLDELERVDAYIQQIIGLTGLDPAKEHNIMLVLTEAVANAILHGNKEDPDKTVEIEALITSNLLKIVVQDQGPGFDPEKVPDPRKEENLLKSSGRGVWIMKEFADEVIYSDNGTRVALHFHI